MRAALGARSDAQLADCLGYSRSNINVWRKRGAVPETALARMKSLMPGIVQARAMQARREELGHQLMYEGLCLALWLAPSIDSLGKRFGAPIYSGTLRNYASYFSEIELACAEQVAERLALIAGNAADALESLTKDDPDKLMKAVLARAEWWRYGYLDEDRYHKSRSLHEPANQFRHEEK